MRSDPLYGLGRAIQERSFSTSSVILFEGGT